MTKTVISDVEQLYQDIFETITDGVLIIDLETGGVMAANPAACALHGYSPEEFLGLHPSAFIHPASQRLFGNYLRAIRASLTFETSVLHVGRDGIPFHAEWRGTGFVYRDRQCMLGVIRNASRRIQADQRLKQRIEARRREQITLLEISHSLASTLELQPDMILEQLRGSLNTPMPGFLGWLIRP